MRALLSRVLRRASRLHPDQAIAARAFDRAFYLQTNSDVADAGVDPLDHFMSFGWREGRDPTGDFSVAAYLAAFPEVEASEVNPFVHYLTSGRPPIRRAPHPLGFRYEIIAGLAPMEARVAHATAAPAALAPEARLAGALARSRGGLAELHVTFSHDDFTANLGGLQAAIQREADRLAELGRDHLHVHPARPWPVVRTAADPGALGVVWNGQAVGAFAPEAIARVLSAATDRRSAAGRSFAIHSLLGHNAQETADIVAAAGLSEGVFWLHDFASLCAGFHLLRNDVEDCAAPPPDSAACGICVYGPWRARHLTEHARLFGQLKLTVAAPSQTTLDLWRRSTGLPAVRAVVLPHARLTPRGPAPATRAGPFRFAYAGLPVAHKGWPIFKALATAFADDPRYEFVHLGARPDPRLPVRFEEVRAGSSRPLAMRDALAAAQADAALVWPLCRETFSFVAHEAVAAGCSVVTSPDSGNVAAFVAEGGHGWVLPDEAALTAAFEDGTIVELARARRRPMLYDLTFSALTLDLARPA
jgi:glycosyltransferase involved in cell wall biosynthesis